ncbi:glycerophosphodiester phosphodiesterase family protein [Olleya sp. YS]|uniref:glycerophosphodiester phosphodiesterase n=1 Tax=Olleya sp. YS TaxID=3028318 RepID=UPI00243443C1|nr:glycerophosphodiester phosphodiesterase family protein [Olleya sp. YS]WGD33600.1 glycerophosphodiester phosphodiesterase family protein [Olleya sp. YS]
MLKIGHRGAKGHVAENTLESIHQAIQFGVDGIEIDVHVCKSGQLVVFHDYTLDRMTNGTGEIGAYTLEQLKQLMVDQKYQIPTLEEVLDLINNSMLINIELKGEATALPACQVIDNYVANNNWSLDNIIVSSFQEQELLEVYNHNPNIPLAVLTKASVRKAINFANTINAKAIHPNFSLLSKDNVKEAQDLGFNVNTWTVNTQQAIKRMKSYRVDAIISDFPDRL